MRRGQMPRVGELMLGAFALEKLTVGLYWDSGKENGKYYNRLYRVI